LNRLRIFVRSSCERAAYMANVAAVPPPEAGKRRFL